MIALPSDMLSEKRTHFLLLIILSVGALLRLALAIYNDGSANDIHLEVAELILRLGHLAAPMDCWQC